VKKESQQRASTLELRGSFVALVTPFRNGAVDFSKLRDLVEFHLKNGTKGIVPCGTTGEGSTLKFEEKVEIFEIVAKTVKDRIPVIAGVGSNDTASAIQLARAAKQAGVHGLLSVAPYYNRPSQRGLLAHFSKLAESVDLPIVLYNIPSRTGVNIDPETLLQLREFKNIVGVKESVMDLDQVSKVVWMCGKDFTVFSGEDALTLPMMALGAKGVISSSANVIPQDMASLCEACEQGEWGRARELHYRLWPLIKSLFMETNPVPVKTAMALMGMIEEEVRLPLVPMEGENVEKIKKALQAYGLLSASPKQKGSNRS